MTQANRYPGLDALRASAVLAVVGSHAAHVAFPAAGWTSPMGGIAVEAFYGLSGYLIGRILLGMLGQPDAATWLRFMARRWARTVPLYSAVLAAAACLSRPDAAEALRFATMTQNLVGPVPRTALGGLMETSWSLTVEELFYFSFATVLLVAVAAFGRRATWPAIVLFLVFPPIVRLLTYGEHDAYFGAIQNLDGIGWGVALAMLERQGSALFRHPMVCLFAGAGMVALAWWPYASGALSQGDAWQPLTLTCAAAGCALVVAASLRLHGLGMLAAPVRAVASRGYSVYLVHWLVLTVFSNLVDNGAMGMATAIVGFLVATAALSWATHRWIEAPGMALASLRFRRTPAAAIA